ncbi:MAG: cytochrome c-551 [Paenibacillaceae bacterium]|jgi:cytochrome c551|nr:MAG: cytochrome c-551 [Paenibacillaceae bacterium]
MDKGETAMAGRKGWLALLLLAVGLTACGGGGGNGTGQGKADEADRVAAEGERLYMNRCMSCHGGELEGGFGPELRNVGERMSREEFIAVVRDGRNTMPAFRDRLTDDEIGAIIDWLDKQ